MTIKDIVKRTDHFESHLLHFADLHPGGDAFNILMPLIRNIKSMSGCLNKVDTSKARGEFFESLSRIEIDADEVLYLLDQLDMLDKGSFTYLVKEGREVMNLCLQLYNFLIEKNIGVEED